RRGRRRRQLVDRRQHAALEVVEVIRPRRRDDRIFPHRHGTNVTIRGAVGTEKPMTITEPVAGPLTADATAPSLRTELPGPMAREILARDEAVTSPSLTRVYPLVVRRAKGCVVEDVDGNRFLDFNAGIAVAAAGHAHPAVNAAIHAQVDDVLHYCSSDFY